MWHKKLSLVDANKAGFTEQLAYLLAVYSNWWSAKKLQAAGCKLLECQALPAISKNV